MGLATYSNHKTCQRNGVRPSNRCWPRRQVDRCSYSGKETRGFIRAPSKQELSEVAIRYPILFERCSSDMDIMERAKQSAIENRDRSHCRFVGIGRDSREAQKECNSIKAEQSTRGNNSSWYIIYISDTTTIGCA
jgi:hypothetical protein